MNTQPSQSSVGRVARRQRVQELTRVPAEHDVFAVAKVAIDARVRQIHMHAAGVVGMRQAHTRRVDVETDLIFLAEAEAADRLLHQRHVRRQIHTTAELMRTGHDVAVLRVLRGHTLRTAPRPQSPVVRLPSARRPPHTPQAAAIGHAGEQVAGDRDRQQLEDDGEGQDEAGLIDSQVDSESE